MRDDGDGEVLAQLVDQVLDACSGNRIERRAGLVHEDHLRIHGDGACDAQPLLLSARESCARLGQPVLDLLEQARPLQARVHDLVELRTIGSEAMQARPVGDIVVDRLGKGLGFWKHHADARAQWHDVDLLLVDILVVEHDGARDAAALDGVVHAVETAQEGGLAAARRADHGDDLVGADVEAHVEDRMLVSVVERRRCVRPSARSRPCARPRCCSSARRLPDSFASDRSAAAQS
jgi:hypothetical protein